MIQEMNEILVAGIEGIPPPNFPIMRVSSRPAWEILRERGIQRLAAHWSYDDRGGAVLTSFDGFPWEKAGLESLTEEEIVRNLNGDRGVGLSANAVKGNYVLEILPPRIYSSNLDEVLPRLPEHIQDQIRGALQNEPKYQKEFAWMI